MCIPMECWMLLGRFCPGQLKQQCLEINSRGNITVLWNHTKSPVVWQYVCVHIPSYRLQYTEYSLTLPVIHWSEVDCSCVKLPCIQTHLHRIMTLQVFSPQQPTISLIIKDLFSKSCKPIQTSNMQSIVAILIDTVHGVQVRSQLGECCKSYFSILCFGLYIWKDDVFEQLPQIIFSSTCTCMLMFMTIVTAACHHIRKEI